MNLRRWRKIKSQRTDQIVLNWYFKDACLLLSARYNYLVAHADVISRKENISAEEVKVLHFNGKIKPWDCLTVMDSTVFNPLMIKFIQWWHRAYLDFLPQIYLRNRLEFRKKRKEKVEET